MNIKPLFDRVLVKPIERENITKSWLYLPDASEERPYMYEVLAIGDGKEWKDMTKIKVWDKILAWQYSWDEVKVDGETYKILALEYILAIIED